MRTLGLCGPLLSVGGVTGGVDAGACNTEHTPGGRPLRTRRGPASCVGSSVVVVVPRFGGVRGEGIAASPMSKMLTASCCIEASPSSSLSSLLLEIGTFAIGSTWPPKVGVQLPLPLAALSGADGCKRPVEASASLLTSDWVRFRQATSGRRRRGGRWGSLGRAARRRPVVRREVRHREHGEGIG